MSETPITYKNLHGRRPGRGIRPWILIPKVICVGVFLGTLAALGVIWWASGFTSLAADDPRRLWTIELSSSLVVRLMVPALLGAMLFGVLLFLQHPRQFARLRWLQVKGLSLLVLMPSAHVFVSSRLGMLRTAATNGTIDSTAEWQFPLFVAMAFAGFAWIVLLGRLKLRLGQNLARTFPTRTQIKT